MTQWQRSATLFERAKQSLAGGVNSNLRLLTKPVPLFFDRAEGANVYDVDGNAYIDYNLGQGPLILGHSHPAVIEAVNQAMRRGQLYAAQHELEIIVAEKMVSLIPCAELCRFGLSGSDMVQAAMRLARAVTGRKKILRFEGHYHGWLDTLALHMPQSIERAGPREHPTIAPHSPGQSTGTLEDFIMLPWNDLALVEALFAERGNEIAAVMCEPMMCNTSAILPESGYLEGLRDLCNRYGALFYMDETITGFRLGLHGAQGRFGVTPDLASFAKAMGAGFANSAIVGRRVYMERFARDVNHSGTFNGNVISMAASAATLAILEADNGAIYQQIERNGAALMTGIREIANQLGIPLLVQGLPAAFHTAFTELTAIKDYRDYAFYCDKERFSHFCIALLRRGVRVIERGMWYLSAAHSEEQIDKTLVAVEGALQEVYRPLS